VDEKIWQQWRVDKIMVTISWLGSLYTHTMELLKKKKKIKIKVR
jgi:hypothetical protein